LTSSIDDCPNRYEARGFGSKKDQNVCAGAFQGCIEVTKPGGRIGVLGMDTINNNFRIVT
jgi:hypothetical protein